MAMQPEIESAIDDIINEAIVQDDDGRTIRIIFDDLKDVDKSTKKKIEDEFENVLRLLNYNNAAQDIFRRWYVDGRLFYNVILDRDNPSSGIQELRYIDPRRIKKIRELKKTKEPITNSEIITIWNEYYIYNDFIQQSSGHSTPGTNIPGVKITKDSIININSGLMDARRTTTLSYLHKAIKPLNQVRMVEDATVIYRISRAPERRIFYIDVGELPKAKAEQYLNDTMAKHRNKLVYDVTTGQVTNDRKHLSMLEDIWLPRRSGSRGTEIDTLSGGENLGVMEDVIYFEKKLYKSLGVPVTRLDPQQGFSLGRSTEISRDELKFMKFIERLRNKFSELFDMIMRLQLSLKGICTVEDWDYFKEFIYFDFIKDNYFTELKESEILTNRLSLLASIDPYTGRYYSQNWIRKNVLRLSDDEIDEMEKEIDEEMKEGDPLGSGPQNPNAMMNPNDPNNPNAQQMQQPQQQIPQPKEEIEDFDKNMNARISAFKP